MSNKELVEELHKPVIRKFKKTEVHTFYRQYLWYETCWYANNK